MFINSKQMTTIRKDANFLSLNKYPAPKGAVVLTALTIYMKRGVQVETDRDIVAKKTVLTADQHYAAALTNDARVVVATFNA